MDTSNEELFCVSQDAVVLGEDARLFFFCAFSRRARDRIPSPTLREREKRERGRKNASSEMKNEKKRNKKRQARERPVTRERARNKKKLDPKLEARKRDSIRRML